ncbi:FbpB family small basic protein [Bacillus sp. HNG]|nr:MULTISPECIES: FbpB family small basic protein [Bacillaceae]MDR4887300.1 FbpB family small basic protein [Fredinandcohnia sp. QZ13]RFB18496.1 FbpB family small basic protein [Bacillus sp. HNG]
MLKRKVETSSFEELIKKNKEEILKDKEELEKIEKRLDEKYLASLK